MKELPLVSIVTPSYNSAHFIRETIESVRSQDYPLIEHIIIDGGSNDGTLEILKHYPQLRWISEQDRGQSEALNKGFRLANGEIIGWLNADDTYRPGTISEAVQTLQGEQDMEIIYSDVRVVDEIRQLIGISRSQPFDLLTLLQSNFVKQPTVFMRRHVIEQLEGVDERLQYTMDRDLWLRAGIAGFKCHYFPGDPWANFRKCPGTKSHDDAQKFRAEWIFVLEETLQNPLFFRLSNKVKGQILHKIRSQYYVMKTVNALNEKKVMKTIKNMVLAVESDWRILLNRGTWLHISMGILGRRVDWRRKFNSKH